MYFHHRRDTRATAARDDGRDGAPATASGAVAQALNASARVSSQYRLAQAINLRPQAIAQAKFAAAIARSPGPLPPQRVGSTAAHAGAQDAVVQRGIYFGKTGEEPPAEEERDADKEPAAEAKHDAEGQPDAESELDALAVVVDEVRNSAPEEVKGAWDELAKEEEDSFNIVFNVVEDLNAKKKEGLVAGTTELTEQGNFFVDFKKDVFFKNGELVEGPLLRSVVLHEFVLHVMPQLRWLLDKKVGRNTTEAEDHGRLGSWRLVLANAERLDKETRTAALVDMVAHYKDWPEADVDAFNETAQDFAKRNELALPGWH